jgi:hypothetical protein
MIAGRTGSAAAANDGVISAQALADCVVEGMDAETFLILPHPIVAEYEVRRASDRDSWLRRMRRVHAMIKRSAGG